MLTRSTVSLIALTFLVDERATQRQYKFAEKYGLDFHFVSAADGTNVVKIFEEILDKALEFKNNPDDNYMLYELMDGVSFILISFRKANCSQQMTQNQMSRDTTSIFNLRSSH